MVTLFVLSVNRREPFLSLFRNFARKQCARFSLLRDMSFFLGFYQNLGFNKKKFSNRVLRLLINPILSGVIIDITFLFCIICNALRNCYFFPQCAFFASVRELLKYWTQIPAKKTLNDTNEHARGGHREGRSFLARIFFLKYQTNIKQLLKVNKKNRIFENHFQTLDSFFFDLILSSFSLVLFVIIAIIFLFDVICSALRNRVIFRVSTRLSLQLTFFCSVGHKFPLEEVEFVTLN